MTGIVFQMPSDIKLLNEASQFFDTQPEGFQIGYTPWKGFSYKPDVKVKCAWQSHGLFLKYYVNEECTRAIYTQPNEPVYKDSCVEFFVLFPGASGYYNFEFNAIGNILAAIGPSRNNREFLPAEVIGNIDVLPSLGKDPFPEKSGKVYWELTVFLPVSVLSKHVSEFEKNIVLRANFYKCGDELSRPHYLCWSEIKTLAPDFHRPEYFGELILS